MSANETKWWTSWSVAKYSRSSSSLLVLSMITWFLSFRFIAETHAIHQDVWDHLSTVCQCSEALCLLKVNMHPITGYAGRSQGIIQLFLSFPDFLFPLDPSSQFRDDNDKFTSLMISAVFWTFDKDNTSRFNPNQNLTTRLHSASESELLDEDSSLLKDELVVLEDDNLDELEVLVDEDSSGVSSFWMVTHLNNTCFFLEGLSTLLKTHHATAKSGFRGFWSFGHLVISCLDCCLD
ncbi:hypothetical protein CY34DRAFT_108623 [Suillus luteus UH-Slu-Lm8-n1]|uniref:Uncharacterized protein n=1 Tax=Suillus luteus UH-Slu-Lm8-n1 TaxID=930992 RepID=A0A0D0AVZ0_9AGAM|nr:hypothetical protein CY34DRAFT_108623 [Suillus luteus UH-Slu-Lm8-n1]